MFGSGMVFSISLRTMWRAFGPGFIRFPPNDERAGAVSASVRQGQHPTDEGHKGRGVIAGTGCEVVEAAHLIERAQDHAAEVVRVTVGDALLPTRALSFAAVAHLEKLDFQSK